MTTPQENKTTKTTKAAKGKAAPKAPKPRTETITYCDPFELRLVGIAADHPAIGPNDTVAAESYPPELEAFADPDRLRAEPIEAYADAAVSVTKHGVKSAVLFKEHDGAKYVTDGRQRVIWARLATIALKEQGDDRGVLVPATLDRAQDALATQILCNEYRREDSTVTKARKAEAARARGYSEDEIRELFGVTRQTLSNWSMILRCLPEILARVESGEIPITTAVKIGQLAPRVQKLMLTYLEAEGATLRGAAGAENVARAAAAIEAQAAPETAAKADVEQMTTARDDEGAAEAEPPKPKAKPELAPAGVRKMTNVQQIRVRARLAEYVEGIDPSDYSYEIGACAAVLLAMRKIAGEPVDFSEWPMLAEAFGEV